MQRWLLKSLAVVCFIALTGCAGGGRDGLPFEVVHHPRSFAFDGAPARPRKALTGQQFIRKTKDMTAPAREAEILKELLHGNVPTTNRQMKAITYKSPDEKDVITLWVMLDYLAIGSDDDFVRIPMNPMTAQVVADAYSCFLPTTKIVDEIYNAADLRLTPRPLPPGQQMIRNGYYFRHEKMIEEQARFGGGVLVAGHKKDVVITNRLLFRPWRVAIYGWHDPMAIVIQPLSLVHHNYYADYSHGIRLIYRTALVNGRPYPLEEIYRDARFHRLVSNEGLILQPRVLLDHFEP